MSAATKLGENEIQQRLKVIPAWTVKNGKLFRQFEFQDFSQAFGFMASVATVAEAMNHHPEWSNVYQTVQVSLATHDANGITERDFELASRMDEYAAPFLKAVSG